MSSGNILIVDDMPEIRMLVRRILQKTSFGTLEASSGQEALKIIKKNDDIELVLLDIMLPDMNGYEVMEKILPLKENRDMKVCFISGKKERNSVLKAIECGGDDYIIKPIFPENLLSKIGILLKKVELIEGYNQLKCKIRAEILYQNIAPDAEIRGLDELSILLFTTAYIKPETQLEIFSQRLNSILGFEGEFSVKVNKCRRESFGKYYARCRFVGIPESMTKEIRSLAIKGQFIGEA